MKGLPGGRAAPSDRQVALDIAVINALGQQHRDETLQSPLRAAIGYSEHKALYQNTRQQCESESIVFEPLVFESQGGVEPRAAAILHRIAGAVAAAEGGNAARLKSEMLQRLAVAIARFSARAIHRRRAPRKKKRPQLGALCEAMSETLLDREDGALPQ